MSYQTVLTVLESESVAKRILPTAMQLASAQQVHIIGLHAIPAPVIHPTFGYEMPAEVWQTIYAQGQEKAERLKALFDEDVTAEVSLNAEWRGVSSPTSDVTDTVLDHARRADLIVIGQVDADHVDGADHELAGSLILEAGRPVLVLPYASALKTIGEIALVAWDGSREAARAAFDALPLLKAAKEVHVIGVDADHGNPGNPMIPGAELATALARHGINAIAETTPSGKLSVAEVLLSRVADRGADLLVMGGYGHSRARERIFGGSTRTVLQSMTAPVLFSN